jgi:hypothetical protein
MTKILTLSVLLLTIFNYSAFSQLKESEVKSLLCHKWNAVTIETQGEKVQIPPGEDFSITFLSDGTFVDAQEKNKKGKWTYSHSTMTITTRGGGVKKILKIDAKVLKLQTVNEDQDIVTFKRVD